MPLIPPSNGTVAKTIIPAGQYVARCYSIVDMGTHPGEWQGVPNSKRLVRLTFEFPEVTHTFKEEKGPQPLVIGREYTLSFGKESNLRKLIDNWTGTKMTDAEANTFDLFSMIGKTVFTNVIHQNGKDGKTYANMAVVMPVPKGMTVGEPVNDYVQYNVEEHDEKQWVKIPEFMQKKIMESKEKQIPETPNDPFSSKTKIEDVPW